MTDTRIDERTALEQAVGGEDLDLAVMALVDLGLLHEREGREVEAEEAYREVIATGHPGQAPRAAYELARLLEARGDTAEARAAYGYVLSTGASEYAGPSVCGLRRLRSSDDSC